MPMLEGPSWGLPSAVIWSSAETSEPRKPDAQSSNVAQSPTAGRGRPLNEVRLSYLLMSKKSLQKSGVWKLLTWVVLAWRAVKMLARAAVT